jgi:hypothetical protein
MLELRGTTGVSPPDPFSEEVLIGRTILCILVFQSSPGVCSFRGTRQYRQEQRRAPY